MMCRENMLWLLLDSVFLLVFNIFFFVLGGTEHETSVWISYGFIHFSYIMLLLTPFFIRKSANALILGYPLYLISSVYLLVTLIAGMGFTYANQESYKGSLIVHVLITGIYAILLLFHMLANEVTVVSIGHQEGDSEFIHKASLRLGAIVKIIDDVELRKSVENLYDVFHVSPIKSSEAVFHYESVALSLIDDLEDDIRINAATNAATILRNIEQNIEERNRRLKICNCNSNYDQKRRVF